jgi:hypothetical protein
MRNFTIPRPAEEGGAGCSHPDATDTAVRLLGSGYDAGLARSRRFPKCLSISAVRLTSEFPTSLCKLPQTPFFENNWFEQPPSLTEMPT